MKAFINKYRRYAALLLAALLVGIDQLTKWLVSSNMKLTDTVNLIKIGDTEVLNLYYCTNNGSAFSMMEGKTTFLVILTSLVIIVLIVALLIKKIRQPRFVWAVAMIIGGGLGNLLDRIFNKGCVIDFIDIRIINFAIFNFADICAVVGGLLLCIFVVMDEVRESRERRKAAVSGTDGSGDTGKPGGEEVSGHGND